MRVLFYTWNILELTPAQRWSGEAQEDVDESLCEHERLIAAWRWRQRLKKKRDTGASTSLLYGCMAKLH